ncbi:hypothetical protein P12x_001772 [Tundrisphaera lichenicola]|uniref:hypothetical protein n=1 Tax=Tundrisphaera lichenicola TaxID=2029860 RepID=UPI003EB994BF
MYASGRRWSIAALLCTAILTLYTSDSAAAGFVAANLADDGSFGWGSYNLTGPKAVTRTGYSYAVRFGLASDLPVAFESAILGLAYRGGINELDVILMSDNHGSPGIPIETIHLSGLSKVPTMVVASSVTHPLLDPSKLYWLVAIATNDSYFSWMSNPYYEAGHLSYRLDTGRGPGPWRSTPYSYDPAFAIMAVPSSGQSSFSLVGIGLMTLKGLRAFRRSRTMSV